MVEPGQLEEVATLWPHTKYHEPGSWKLVPYSIAPPARRMDCDTSFLEQVLQDASNSLSGV